MRLTYIFTSLRLILRCIGIVILAPVLVALYYGDYSSVMPFVTPSLICFVISFIFKTRSDTFESLNDIKKSEALCVGSPQRRKQAYALLILGPRKNGGS